MDTLPQCKAKSKRSGKKCKNFCVKGKAVCHIHGGKSTGPSEKGRHRIKALKTKHGHYSKETIEERRMFREYISNVKKNLGDVLNQK